jgi:hypothetical protein
VSLGIVAGDAALLYINPRSALLNSLIEGTVLIVIRNGRGLVMTHAHDNQDGHDEKNCDNYEVPFGYPHSAYRVLADSRPYSVSLDQLDCIGALEEKYRQICSFDGHGVSPPSREWSMIAL